VKLVAAVGVLTFAAGAAAGVWQLMAAGAVLFAIYVLSIRKEPT
jgi:hypothetical protein